MARNVVDLGERAGHIITPGGETITVDRVGAQTLVTVTGHDGDGRPCTVTVSLTPELGEQLVTRLSGAVIRATDHQIVSALPA